ncbi:hypothetical protein PFISCL1PPCAC_13254, partial [Pristionchus fissidentatus]
YELQTTIFFNYFTRVAQGLSNLYICLNRASAIILPLFHHKIWTRAVIALALVVQFTCATVFGLSATVFDVHWLRYPRGQLFALPNNNPNMHKFSATIFVPVAAALLTLIVLYAVIMWRFRARLM